MKWLDREYTKEQARDILASVKLFEGIGWESFGSITNFITPTQLEKVLNIIGQRVKRFERALEEEV